MRADLMNTVTSMVNGYRALHPPKGYDYHYSRRRQIFEALTQGVQYVFNNAVEGDVAEFGTAGGFSALTIAHAMTVYRDMYRKYLAHHAAAEKILYLFDSFQGFPAPESPVDRDSPNVTSGRWKEGSFNVLNKDELLALCSTAYDRDKIRTVEGWFSASLPTIPVDAKFALVHLDCDLYSSTVEVLDHLLTHRHLADGCCVFFDDWNCNRASPRFGQRRAWREMVAKHKVDYSDDGGYAVLGHRFTVHVDA